MIHGHLQIGIDLSDEAARSRDVPLSARLLNAAIAAAEAEGNNALVDELLGIKQREAQRRRLNNTRMIDFSVHVE